MLVKPTGSRLLFGLILLYTIVAIPAFHTVNDFDLNGKVCPLPEVKGLACNQLCVKDISSCPKTLQFNCADGTSPCLDGSCKSDCSKISNVCACGSESTSYKPCFNPKLTVNITSFDGKIKNKMINDACAKTLELENDVEVWKSGIDNENYWAVCPPSEPAKFTFREPMWISVFSILGGEILLFVLWYFYKQLKERGVERMYACDINVDSDLSEKSDLKKINEKGEEIKSTASDTEDFPIKGFVTDYFGTFMTYSFLLISIGWLVYLAVITADYYGAITGKEYGIAYETYDLSSTMFIGIWIFATSWFVTLNVFRSRIINFFRIEVYPLDSQYIQVEQAQSTVLMLDDGSKVLAGLRSIERNLKEAFGWNYRVTTVNLQRTQSDLLYFSYRCRRYVYDAETSKFQPFQFDLGSLNSQFLKLNQGLTQGEANRRLELKGPNFIEVYVPSFLLAFGEEMTSFFYLYQLMIMWLFYYLSYFEIGLVDTAVIFLSAFIKVVVRLRSEKRVKQMAEHQDSVKVKRDGQWMETSTAELVPGDVFQVENGKTVPCDAVLLTGNVVADESSLTGEPLPIRKFPVKDESVVYDRLGSHKLNSLFAGTIVRQTTPVDDSSFVEALVYQTSTSTDKGQLVYKILFPNPISFIFDEQLKLVVCILACWGIVLFAFSLWLMKKGGTASWFYGMFCLAQILSPILPAALVVGQSVAADQLRKKKIYCVDLPRIMVAGKVQIFCFDKTGTLTKEGLEFYGGQSTNNNQFDSLKYHFDEFDPLFQLGMASCHSVTQLEGNLIGNPVDIEMFNATKWHLLKSASPNYVDSLKPASGSSKEAHIVKRFEFVHARASMSVAVLDETTGHVHVFVKGSFEKLKELANPNSIPVDYDATTSELAQQGCYVLALAHRDLGKVDLDSIKDWTREKLESSIDLLGLVIFKNQLKEDTTDAITELKQGNTRTVMITGDTALTGIYIAQQCNMLPPRSKVYLADLDSYGQVKWTQVATEANLETEKVDNQNLVLDTEAVLATFPTDGLQSTVELAMTGKAFNKLLETDSIDALVLNTRVFARMTPTDKVNCVKLHMARGVTAMCGDGGNDCGALRAAHVGIALSEAEASIVSPFSSNFRSIQSCVELLRQGRAALATSFAGYKYLIMYGEIMAWLKIHTFYFSISPSQNVWILVDAFITIGMTFAITQSKAATKLAPFRPTARLLGWETMASTVGQVFINAAFIMASFGLLFQQEFFKCHEFDASAVDLSKWYLLGDNFEGELLAFVTLFQFVNAAAIYNFGYKFRQPFFKNYILMAIWAVFVALLLYALLADPNAWGCLLRMNCGDPEALIIGKYAVPNVNISKYNIPLGHNVFPPEFRYKLLGLILGNMAVSFLWELVVVIGPIRDWLRNSRPLNRLQVKL